MQTSFMNRVVSLCETCVIAWMTKTEELLSMEICAACHGKAVQGPSGATGTWGSQHVRQGKIYSLSTFVFYLIKTAILLHCLFLDLSSLRWRENPAASLSPSLTPHPGAGTWTNSIYSKLLNLLLCFGSCSKPQKYEEGHIFFIFQVAKICKWE